MSFEVLLDIMEFALNNAIVKMPEGKLLRQTKGIPMGDPLSPAMTIGACAWMEEEWMQQLDGNPKGKFVAKRYMDDILVAYAENQTWDHERFCEDFEESTCYVPPLKLELGRQNTFLETSFMVDDKNGIRYKVKNDHEDGVTRVWRYQHFCSHTPYIQKRVVLTSCLLKVHKMAGDNEMRYYSAIAKINEFKKLGYPRHMLKAACTYIAATQGERSWLDIRDQA